jgi:hypothetical protein
MKSVLIATALLLAVCVSGARAGKADETPAARETWKAEWSNRLSGLKGEWMFILNQGDGVLSGTVTVDGVTHELAGKREGAWLEINWKDAKGQVTQVRVVAGAGEWRGVVFSGGGGRWVEYGRVRAQPVY